MTPHAWSQVLAESARIGAQDLSAFVTSRPLEAMLWRAPYLVADVYKQPIDPAAMNALLTFAEQRGLAARIADLFAGRIVNSSESRPALHWALRGGDGGLPLIAAMRREQAAASAFAAKAAGGHLGFDVRTILHIGIGGSDLGPRLIWDALRVYGRAPEIRFCANVDAEDFHEATAGIDAATTLVIVVSKSFKTPETASNAALAREWLSRNLGESNVNAHLAAVSSAPDRARAWGAAPDRIFPMDEAVGGRYSVWSSVGLSLQIALGPDIWARFLAGAAEMDRHFRDAPLAKNTPACMAMLDVFLHTARNIASRTVLAYAHRLRRLPDFLQQLEMESNGKSAADSDGGLIGATGPVVWGSVGTLGQHSFHQLLHQGMRDTAIEFVVALDAARSDRDRGRALLANAFAQAEGLLAGRSASAAEAQLLAQGVEAGRAREQARHMHMAGGRGSTTVALEELSPESIGALISFYEHRTFAAGVMWGINPFDQWGVERGKVLAEELDAAILGGPIGERDASTAGLVERARQFR